MKIAVICSLDYSKQKIVEDYISYLELVYRPFGNMDDEYEEPIIIRSLLDTHLDIGAIVKSKNNNFTVEHLENLEELIKDCDELVIFIDNGCSSTNKAIELALKERKNIQIFNT